MRPFSSVLLFSFQMNGTFTFTAEGFIFPPGGQPVEDVVSVTGTFQASGGQFLVPPIT